MNHFGLQAAGFDQGGHDLHRPEIGKQVQPRPQGEKAAFRSLLPRERVKPRTADRRHQHRIRRSAGVQSFVGQRLAGGIDRSPSDQLVIKVQLEAVAIGHHVEQLASHCCDFRADAITRKQDDAMVSHGAGREGWC